MCSPYTSRVSLIWNSTNFTFVDPVVCLVWWNKWKLNIYCVLSYMPTGTKRDDDDDDDDDNDDK